jgi:hypothetical protein
MRKLLTFLIALAAVVVGTLASPAITPQQYATMMLTGAGRGAPAAGGCSQATTFLARTSGLSGTETIAYTDLICGLVTDGIITGALSGAAGCGTVLDGIYILATNTTATANLNLCGTSFGLTTSAAPTFSADHGYTGNGTTQFLDTGFNPSTAGGRSTLNSSSLGVYTLTNRASNSTVQAGVADATAFSYVGVFQGGNAAVDVNGFTFSPGSAVSASQGLTAGSRTVSGSIDSYKNASSTSLGTITDASTNLPNRSYYICGYNNAGTLTSPTSDQIAAAFFGAGITGAQFLLLSNRINAYMTALSINVY